MDHAICLNQGGIPKDMLKVISSQTDTRPTKCIAFWFKNNSTMALKFQADGFNPCQLKKLAINLG